MRSIHSGASYQISLAKRQAHPRKRRLKTAFCVDPPIHPQISEEVVLAAKEVVNLPGKGGYNLTEISYPLDDRKLVMSYYQMNGVKTAATIRSTETGTQRAVRREEFEPISWTLFQYGQKLSATTYIDSLHIWDEATIVMENLHQEYDLFLSPTTAFTAPEISEDLQSDVIRVQVEHISGCLEVEGLDAASPIFGESLKTIPYTQLANLTGQPVIGSSTHLVKENMLPGIQLMAARGREDLLFQIGYLFETNHQFHLPSPWK